MLRLFVTYFFLSFRIFEQLALDLKTVFALNSLYSIYIFCLSRFLNNLCLPLKNTICPDIFHCIEIFSSFRNFEQLALALKTVFALNSLYWIYIFYLSRFLSNLCLPWKTRAALKCFTVLKYFHHTGFLSNLCLPWIHCIQYICFPPVWIIMIISCWSVKLLKLPSVTLTHVCGTNSHNWLAKGLPEVGVVKVFCDSDSLGWKSLRLRLLDSDSDSTALDSTPPYWFDSWVIVPPLFPRYALGTKTDIGLPSWVLIEICIPCLHSNHNIDKTATMLRLQM